MNLIDQRNDERLGLPMEPPWTLTRCWRQGGLTSVGRCTHDVSAAPDHIGLCDMHLEELRRESPA